MDFSYPPEVEQFRKELHTWLAANLTDEVVAAGRRRGRDPDTFETLRRWDATLADAGWGAVSWPREYGGRGATVLEQLAYAEETTRARAPVPLNVIGMNNIAPAIMQYGTDSQKRELLRRMVRADDIWCQGMSEPEAGSDLASLRTRAVRDGDDYVVNGQKIWTSLGHRADWCQLYVRTDADAPKHKGISILCMSTDSPGFSWSPIVTVAGARTTATYYADVRVPVEQRVGPENEGWRMITTQLNHERVGLAAWSGFASQLYEEVATWAAVTPTPDGHPVLDLGWVQSDLARCRAELEAMYLLNWRMAAALSADNMSPADSSTVKVFGVERSIGIYRRLLGIVGAAGYLTPDSPGAVLQGRLERTARHAQINTFGGGVNEIQREIVAMAGLGMTRAAR